MQEPTPSTSVKTPAKTHAMVLSRKESSSVIISSGIAEKLSLGFPDTKQKQYYFGSYPEGNAQILKANPFLPEGERMDLDDGGIIKLGSVISDAMVAVSAIKPAKVDLQDALLAALLGPDTSQKFHDASIRFGVNDEGFTVIKVEHETARDILTKDGIRSPGGVTDRITISLQRQCPLVEGELVEINGQTAVVGEILSSAEMTAMANMPKVDAIVPDSIGLLSEDGKMFRAELTRSRPHAIECIQARRIGTFQCKEQWPDTSSNPIAQEISANQIAWLLNHGFEETAKELAILKSDERVHRHKLQEFANGNGESPLSVDVAAPESLFEVVEYLRVLGLDVQADAMRQRVRFGLSPASDQQRAAVAPKVMENGRLFNSRTQSPEQGGLLCERIFGPATHSRRRTGARIELSSPIIPIIHRLGEHPLLSRVLEMEISDIEKILSGQLALDRALQIQTSTDTTCEYFGSIAIEQLLHNCSNQFALDPKDLVCRFVYVLPPDYRTAEFLNTRFFLRDDLNLLYSRIVSWNRRLDSWSKSAASPQQIEYGRLMLQRSVDNLYANEWLEEPSVNDEHLPHRSVLKLLEDKLCRSVTKPVDWSGAARVISDCSLTNQDCSLPVALFDTLQCRSEHPVFLSGSEGFVACSPLRSSEHVIRISQESLSRLNLKPGDQCHVFRPLTSTALQDATDLKKQYPKNSNFESDRPRRSYELNDLFNAISSNDPWHLDSPEGFMLAGYGNFHHLADGDAVLPGSETRELPEIKRYPPSIADVQEVIESLAFESLLLTTPSSKAGLDKTLNGAGRIGGKPLLPSGTEWPREDGVAVPFLAQFPVDPQFNASLPFDLTEPMVLTIFWADHWWSIGNTNVPCILLHKPKELVLTEPPPGTTERPQLQVRLEAKRQLPDPQQILSVLNTCFGKLPSEIVDALHESLKEDDRQITKNSRLGGNAYWIQEKRPHFMAQLIAHDLPGMDFGDAGCLYIVGAESSGLRGYVQCH